MQSTGQWNGLIRSIMDGEADMVMTSLKITPERNQMIDFSVPFLETGITILVAVREGVISPTAFLGEYHPPSTAYRLRVHAYVQMIHENSALSYTEYQFSIMKRIWYKILPVNVVNKCIHISNYI